MPFHFSLPTAVECGCGISDHLGEHVRKMGYRTALIVTDPGVRKAGLLDKMVESLERENIGYGIFDDVVPNPSAQHIERGAEAWRERRFECVIAVGGGSSIDTAKGVAAMATNPGSILDYEGVGRLPNATVPLIAVPTTAGTGSEVTSATIVTNTEQKFKAAVISPHLYPRLALLDALLTLQLPQPLTAATGMDALTHAIESYTSKSANPVSQGMALQAVRMIGRHLTRAYFVGTDAESREQMLVASMIAGAAFSQSRLGNVHAISHTLGGVFNIAHGIANATLLPYVMEFNLPACPGKMKEIAEALGEDTRGLSEEEGGRRAITAILRLNRALGIPSTIRELGVSLDWLPKLVEDSMRSGNVRINPRLTGPDDIRRIIENAYHGVLEHP
jgi:alcohol dehydrogenase class IV